nr:TPA_asm: M23 uORF [Murid betaherpesvirus 1]DBA07940.1 TPA_asm: M23 uORF [Murid betaherpesvirus 1]
MDMRPVRPHWENIAPFRLVESKRDCRRTLGSLCSWACPPVGCTPDRPGTALTIS